VLAIKTYDRSEGIAPLILNLGNRWRRVVSFTPQFLYPRRINPRYALCRGLGGSQIRYIKTPAQLHTLYSGSNFGISVSGQLNWVCKTASVACVKVLSQDSTGRLRITIGDAVFGLRNER
jgi:hypothetical protein